MNTTVGTRGKAVHAVTVSGGTRCGAEYGTVSRNGKTSSPLHSTDKAVTCRKCAKIEETLTAELPAPVRVAGPNARENFTAMVKAAVSPASVAFWTRKLNALPAS